MLEDDEDRLGGVWGRTFTQVDAGVDAGVTRAVAGGTVARNVTACHLLGWAAVCLTV